MKQDVQKVHFNVSPRIPLRVYFNAGAKVDRWLEMHYPLEMGIVISGQVRLFSDAYECMCREGDVWLCGMWEPHGYDPLSDMSAFVRCLIDPELLAKLWLPELSSFNWLAPFQTPPQERPRVAQGQRQYFCDMARRFRAAQDEKEEGRRMAVRHLLVLETLLELTRNWDAQAGYQGADGYTHINSALRIVLSRQDRVTVKEAAAACRMPRNRFSRVFREVMGMPFPEFCMRHRLSGAAEDLAQTDQPIKAVARDWGFVDDSHLHHHFRQRYDVSPGPYRSRHRAET